MDGQPAQIQQHDEETDSEQQHGRTYLAPGHHLQELQERRFPLDYNAQPAAQDMEWRKDTLHLKVISETFVSIDWSGIDAISAVDFSESADSDDIQTTMHLLD